MCGITGCISLHAALPTSLPALKQAVRLLQHRGPDAAGIFQDEQVAFGHCRLSVIDVSEAANQPMQVDQVVITYNGEIFNYRELRRELEQQGEIFHTQSDTEVLLRLYRRHGIQMLDRLNGFFAFALYDAGLRCCWLVRDRFGVKPLYYHLQNDQLFFASELDALLPWAKQWQLDEVSLFQYLQLSYIPAPYTICREVFKLPPGSFLEVELKAPQAVQVRRWYSLPSCGPIPRVQNYEQACRQLFELVSEAVRLRLVSDVPLGTFLSGGLDSSIITGLASRFQPRIKSFSIGFQEDPFFDETEYARRVAQHFLTDHVVFSLSRRELAEAATELLHHPGEPFADASAILVFLLSKKVRSSVKVVLSGDGADELFGGYLKHTAEYRIRHPGLTERVALFMAPLLAGLPQSRNNWWQNRLRQVQRFAAGARLPGPERYWRWCSLASPKQAAALLAIPVMQEEFLRRQKSLTHQVALNDTLEGVMLNDVHLVLPDDMLMKVDRCSMAHGLEVREPFLDYRVVEFAFHIPDTFKVDRQKRKKIINDTFCSLLPPELYHRPKRGFEVPLQALLTTELRHQVASCCDPEFLRQQGIFDPSAVEQLRRKLFSGNPEDSAAHLWGLMVFQHWWRRHEPVIESAGSPVG
ncbi:MAG: asparagine synthase (glutamine-hydrolyzing) [Chitinophagales bacterium]|nr:asparagine synthase (glutamine-hydrolyzing) [Chitinophagales bacterium]MDW8428087.1 asparagine synthase (glutamine-hydrolyzing) [Chitinophagales bacterium]